MVLRLLSVYKIYSRQANSGTLPFTIVNGSVPWVLGEKVDLAVNSAQ